MNKDDTMIVTEMMGPISGPHIFNIFFAFIVSFLRKS